MLRINTNDPGILLVLWPYLPQKARIRQSSCLYKLCPENINFHIISLHIIIVKAWLIFSYEKDNLYSNKFGIHLYFILSISFAIFFKTMMMTDFFKFTLFIYLVALGLSCGTCAPQLQHACGIQFPNQGSNPAPLHWERRVLTTAPPGKSLILSISYLNTHYHLKDQSVQPCLSL